MSGQSFKDFRVVEGDATSASVVLAVDLGNGSEVQMTLSRDESAREGVRRCGSCSLCCRLVPVATLAKPAGTKCRYSRHNAKGCCRVYATKLQPEGCRVWSCRWLIEPTMNTQRPDRTHYLVDVLPDFVQAENADGTLTRHPVIQVWVDPDHPDAHRDKRLRDWIAAQAPISGAAALVRYGETGDVLLLVPPTLNSTGNWIEHAGKASVGSGVGLWNKSP